MAEPRVLKLQSPAYGDPIFYKWPLVNTKKHDEASEICDTIRLVCEDFPELKFAVENFILKDHDGTDYDSMNHICQRYNKAIKNILALWKGRAPPPHMFKPPKKELLRHIINLCFSHAIKEPEKLNIYEPFSPEVYGETSFDMVAQILEECKKSNEETFIDLGSGVGQVVLQAAASNQFKECFGVEKAETPAMYAKAMDEQFRKWMDWFGKTYTDFTLEKGDFLEDKWTEIINNSGFVFVNNFAFGPLVNHHLKERFQQMKEGAQIISSREYCPLNFKFNKRNLSELGAMMRVTELKPKSEEQTVSWTGNVVSYYLHVVDRTRLEKYFSILKKRKEGRDLDEDELSLYSESNVSVDTGKHEETLEENLDELYLGTTTRHQWQVLNETLKQSRNDVKDEDEANTKKKKKKKKKIKDDLSDPSSISTTSITQKSGNIQMKDKILQKYGHQKVRKAIANLPNTSPSLTSSTSTANKSLKGRKKNSLYLAASSPSSSETDTSPEDDEDVDDDEEWVPPVQQDKNNNKLKEKKTKKKHLITASTTSKKKKESIKSWQTNNSSKESKGNADTTNKKASSTTKKQKDTAAVKTASAKSSKKKNKEGPSKDFFTNLDRQVDEFYDSMKVKAKEFIRRINTEEYANRLQTMIECEQTKKKLLQREVTEMEQTVQQLITTGLTNFSNRLVELDLAVKTPLELLSTSTQLAEKRQDLENKVLNMEVEVFNLEEKYKNMCVARNVKNESLGLPPIEEVMPTEQPITCQELENHRNELTSQLCGSILSALNHRKNLIDKQSSLNEQISILEKITSPTASLPNEELDSYQAEEMSKDERPLRPRPVAYVPPRMIGEDQNQIVISPEGGASQSEITPTRRGRGRPRKEQEEEQEEKNSFVVTREMLTSATERNTSQVLEERAPIVFPNSLKNEETDEISKKFLQASSKLLQSSTCEMSSHKGKWKPLQEIDSFRQISSSPEHVTNHMTSSSATIPSVIKETNPSHPKLKDIEQRYHNTSTITTRPPNEQKPPDEEIHVSEEPKIMEPPIQPPSIALPSIPPPPTKILIHDQAPVTGQHLQKVHKFNIYDNLQLSFLQQRDFLNRAPIVTTHAITQRQPSATVTVSACSKPTITPRLPSMSLQSSGPLTTPFSMDSLAQSSAITMSQQQLHRIQNAAQNSIPIIHHPSTSVFFQAYPHGKHPINVLSKTSKETDATKKPKRGRKRKTVDESVDMSSNIIVPGKHVKAHKQKRKDSTCTKNNNSTIVDFKREVEDHFKTSLDQIHQQFHNRQQTTTQQPVMSSSSIKNIQIPLRVQPSDALAPSLHQQRPSNLDILKQAAFANLPERSTTTSGVLYQPLSNPLATSSVSTTECKPAATLKTVQVAKTIIPVNTTGPNSLYALHNRIVEHPVASSLNRTKNAPSFIQQPISTIAHVKNQTKSKKSKKEIQLPIQVIPHKLLAAAPLAQSGHLHPVTHFIRPATHDSNLLRSMLLTSPQEATSAHKLLVMNPPSTVHAHHPLAVAGASKPDQRLMILPEHLQATRSPVVFLPSPAAPALPPSRPASIIVDASRPSSSNASPTFPPPKPS